MPNGTAIAGSAETDALQRSERSCHAFAATLAFFAGLLFLASSGSVQAAPGDPQPVELYLTETRFERILARPGDVIRVSPVTINREGSSPLPAHFPSLLWSYSGEKTLKCKVTGDLYLCNGKVVGVLIYRRDTVQTVARKMGRHGPDLRAVILDDVGRLPTEVIAKLLRDARGRVAVSLRIVTCGRVPFGDELPDLAREVGRISALEVLVYPCLSDRMQWTARAKAAYDRSIEKLKLLAPIPWLSLTLYDYSLRGLRDIGQLANLRHLYIPGWLRGPRRTEVLRLIANLTKLEELDLSRSGFGDSDVRVLLRYPRLRKLDLSHNAITDQSLSVLGQLTHLEDLNLKSTYVRGARLDRLCSAPWLRHLNLESTRVDDAAMQHLPCLRNLAVLNLSQTRIASPGMRYVGQLARLRELYLENTRVDDQGLTWLGALTELRTLYADRTRVRSVAGLSRNAAIESLSLDFTPLTDPGIESLRSLVGLRSLSLSNTGITRASLSTLRQLQGLTTLDLGGTRIPETDLKDLRKQLPGCWVR